MKKILFVCCAFALLFMTTTGCNSSGKREQAIADSIARADSIAKVDSIARADSIASVENMFIEQAPEKIKEFYRKYVFGTIPLDDESVTEYCTEKLIKKLRDDYEYDDGGYAVWDFRSGDQDGDFDAQALTDVESLGEGKFKASYFDMGNVQSVILTVIFDGDKILFDEIVSK